MSITFIFAACAGFIIGLLSGLLGIGGGTVMVPLLRLGFFLPAIEATATSLFAIVPTSISGALAHIRNRTCVIGVGVAAGLAGACTSPFGVLLAAHSPGWAIIVAAILVVAYSAYTMLRKAIRMSPVAQAATSDTKESAHGKDEPNQRIHATRKQCVVGALSGLLAGVLSGYVGVGGGFIMVPLFIAFAGISMKQASGTSLIAVAILAIPGVITQVMLGNVHMEAAFALAIGSIPGAIVGARIIRWVPERTLRFIFGGMLLVMAGMLALNEILLPA